MQRFILLLMFILATSCTRNPTDYNPYTAVLASGNEKIPGTIYYLENYRIPPYTSYQGLKDPIAITNNDLVKPYSQIVDGSDSIEEPYKIIKKKIMIAPIDLGFIPSGPGADMQRLLPDSKDSWLPFK
jgi:hypothetical protein